MHSQACKLAARWGQMLQQCTHLRLPSAIVARAPWANMLWCVVRRPSAAAARAGCSPGKIRTAGLLQLGMINTWSQCSAITAQSLPAVTRRLEEVMRRVAAGSALLRRLAGPVGGPPAAAGAAALSAAVSSSEVRRLLRRLLDAGTCSSEQTADRSFRLLPHWQASCRLLQIMSSQPPTHLCCQDVAAQGFDGGIVEENSGGEGHAQGLGHEAAQGTSGGGRGGERAVRSQRLELWGPVAGTCSAVVCKHMSPPTHCSCDPLPPLRPTWPA